MERHAIPVHVEIEVGVALSFIRDGGLRSGASVFRHLARWLDRASTARELAFGLPAAKVTFCEAYPTPWRLADREVVDRDGCNVQDFDDDPDAVEFWRGVVDAVNGAATDTFNPCGSGPALIAPTGDGDVCPGHVASPSDPKVCGRCGIHIDELRPPDDDPVNLQGSDPAPIAQREG